MIESKMHQQDSEFYGWASSEKSPEEAGAMQLKKEYTEALKNLPRYKDVDIVDLFSMAEEKLTYTKRSGRLSGKTIKGIKITDKAFAIAILIGLTKLDDPILQMPATISLGDGVPKITLSGGL